MSVSKRFLNAWTYDPDDVSSHDTRSGMALLPPGIQWRTAEAFAKVLDTSKPKTVQQILAESDDPIALAAAATHGPMPGKPKPSSPALSDSWSIPCTADDAIPSAPMGMVVVDRQGVPLTETKDISMCKTNLKDAGDANSNSPSVHIQGLQASRQRTAKLWQKINPGCMPDYSDLPQSTTHELMIVDYSKIPPVDKTYYRMKNEFTEYTEQGASTMKALISDKK